MIYCYVLFETDVHKSKSSRVFLGVFRSFELANCYAKRYNCYTNETEVVILEVELDKFEEMYFSVRICMCEGVYSLCYIIMLGVM